MKNNVFKRNVFWLLLTSLFSFSCQDEMAKHYEVPDWLKGSAWEVLESEGNYSIFLEGVERIGYKPMVEGKSILTVMAPNDSAFQTYFAEKGYSSIAEIPVAELNKLIGFHLLYYSYNKERMENFRPEGDGLTDEEKLVNAGLYYKFRTRSTSAPTVEFDQTSGKRITVYHLERFIPVFSSYFFNSKRIDAKANYEYFYPNSTWTGSNGFNVSSASVKEYALVANNGYVYTIDKVLEPLETIYNELKSRDEYSTFLNLYNSYSTYEYDLTLSTDYGASVGVDSLYLHKHGTALPPIALEWPNSSYQAISSLASVSYSVFAPSNRALNTFFSNFWEKGEYDSLEDVDPLVMKHLLNQYVYGGSVVFPEEITKGQIKNSYGMAIDFNPATITDKAMCVNGSFYGIDNLETPPLFASAVGPAFRNKYNANYLYVLDGSSLLNSLASPEGRYTMLIPSDAQMEESGYHLMSYESGNILQEFTTEGWANVGSSTMLGIVNTHTMNGTIGLNTTGTQICPTQAAFYYWYVKDGKIASSSEFSKLLTPDYSGTPFVPFTEITNNGSAWNNGKSYSYDSEALFTNDTSDGLNYALSISNDNRYPYNAFVQLMKKAGMVSGTSILNLTGRFVLFIPTNEAVAAALAAGEIPGAKNASYVNGTLNGTFTAGELASYLYSYFITSELNVLTSYPYPSSLMRSGEYMTIGGREITYTDSGTSLKVQMSNRTNVADVITDYDYFPFAYQDGCFHLIDKTL